MSYFTERVLTDELAEAKTLLSRAIAILDAHNETEAAYCTCAAVERLVRAPSTLEQWYIMTGRQSDGSDHS